MSLNINFDQDFIDAADYVLKEHLSLPYTEGFGDGGRQPGYSKQYIDRPLHGLIHAMRKVAYAPVYYQLLKNKGVKGSEALDENELKKIMIALLFQISGRQSEFNSGDKRGRYRQASADNFEKFAKKHMSHLFKNDDIKKYKAIIAEAAHNPYQHSLEMKIMRQVHALELIRLQDKSVEMFYMSDNYNGIAGGLVKQFDEKSALDYMDYIVSLFEATGDTLDKIDIGPGKQFISLQQGEITYPKSTPVFKRDAVPLNLATFEECQYSVEKCLQQIVSVKPPFGIQYLINNKKPVATTSPQPPLPKKLSDEEKMRLLELQQMEYQLKDEIDSLQVLGEENEVKIYIQSKEAELQEIKKEIVKLTGEAEKDKENKSTEQKIYGANPYQVMVKNNLCYDGVLRDEVRIPGDNNCCYNAALVAAKHAGIQLPHGINNHYELRQEVARRMRAEYDLDPDDNAGDFAAAIEGYNREFRTNLETFDDYIKEVETLDTWGGDYELKKMSEILGMNIMVFSDRQQAPFLIQSNLPQAPTVNLHHTGNHYNFYVAPNTWQELPPHDPVILFEQQIDQIRHRNILAKLRETETQRAMKTELHTLHKGNTRQHTPINYENYIETSKKHHESGIAMKRLIHALEPEEDKVIEEEEKRRLELQLKKNERLYADTGKELEEMRKAFKSDPSFNKNLIKRYSVLMKEYDHQIYMLSTTHQHVRSLLAKQVAMLIKHVPPESAEFIKLKSQIEEAKKTQQSVKEQANDILAFLETEMTFILREITPINDIEHDHAIARYKRKVNLAHKHLEAKDSDDVEVNFDVVSMIHLKNFLKAYYDPALSLKENIKQYFQDPLIRVMLYMGGDVEGRKLYDHPQIGLQPHIQDFQREGGQYDEELIEHLCEQLEKMVLAETQNAGTYALYNAMAGDLSVGNDVIRELSSLFAGKGYDAMFRLFSTGFDYETAEDFRKDVYETKKVMDGGSEFHSRGLCCGLSPFQPLQNESPLDFWAHNRNIQGGFDRWQAEILPKLRGIISDEKTIQQLNREYQELVELSKQLGARMTQFLMSPEDIDQYTWLSGAYGFKLPAMTTKLGQLVETDKLSEALDFYTEAPDDFIRETENRRKLFMDAPGNADKFVDHLGKNHKTEVYDETYNTAIENRKNLGQLQARLYLHPDLFEPGRMQVNTYYSLPDNPRIEAEYNDKLHQFSEKVCGLVIRAQRENRAKTGGVPDELNQSIFMHPFKYTDKQAHQEAQALLKQMVQPKGLKEGPAFEVSPLFESIKTINQQPLQQMDKINQTAIQINSQYSKDEEKQAALYRLFLDAIASGDIDAFRLLKAYSLSENYNHKYFPINFDTIPHEGSLVNAIMLAAHYDQTAMLQELLTTREQNIGILNRPSGHLALRRMAIDETTADTPLHYLANVGNIEGFKMLVQSLISRRSYTSYLFHTGIHQNKDDNTPLHILAFNEPATAQNRKEILSYLLDEKSETEFDTLFGVNAVTAINQFGLSPIMIAALTQNIDAINLFAEKAKLSNNQRLIYLWIAQAPYQHLAEIQRNIEQYGDVPGFVPPQWKMPSQFQKLQHEQEPEFLSSKPQTIDELKAQFEQALTIKDNLATIDTIYNDLLAAQESIVLPYLSQLLSTNSKGQHRNELDNLENLAKKHKFKLSTARKQKKEEDTPLLIAAKEGNLQTVHKLLSNKSTFDTRRTSQDSVGKTALHYLVELPDSAEVVNLLLSQRSWSQLGSNAYNPTCQQDNDGNTPVHLLAQSANLTLLDAINKFFSSWMGHGVYNQLNAASLMTNNEGKTPIMVAALEHPDKPALIQYFGVAMGYKEHDPEIKLYQDLANAIVSKNKEQIQERLLAVSRGKTWKNIDISAETLLEREPKRIRKAF